MRDRGTLIAATGIAVAFLVAGIVFFFVRAEQARHQALEEVQREAEDARARLEAERERFLNDRENAAERGVAYLVKQQSPDGAWRSDLYATFKDGAALTPLVVCALQDAGEPVASAQEVRAAIRKGCIYLIEKVKNDLSIEGEEGELDYPVYSAALAIKALTYEMNRDRIDFDSTAAFKLARARDAWNWFLLKHQLTEKIGWKPDDKQYGGWGYCRFTPKKPEPGAIAPSLVESNVSATAFVLEALEYSVVHEGKAARYGKALLFLRRCQNDDGGFHFIYDDPVRNKAGSPDLTSRPLRFNSYGAATADGLRALLICKADAREIGRAKEWLEAHFKPDSHPGKYIPAHEPNREAVYYYYAASVSKALRAAKVKDAGGKPWAETLSAELAKRQKPDGSWANPVELVRENEPLVATANAVIALANCKAAIVGK